MQIFSIKNEIWNWDFQICTPAFLKIGKILFQKTQKKLHTTLNQCQYYKIAGIFLLLSVSLPFCSFSPHFAHFLLISAQISLILWLNWKTRKNASNFTSQYICRSVPFFCLLQHKKLLIFRALPCPALPCPKISSCSALIFFTVFFVHFYCFFSFYYNA